MRTEAMMPSRERQRQHAIENVARRYHRQMTPAQYNLLCQDIDVGNAKLVLCQDPGREVWEVAFQGVRLTAVFDTFRRNIVTFLPRGIVPGQKSTYNPR
jgi:hypothetical protein